MDKIEDILFNRQTWIVSVLMLLLMFPFFLYSILKSELKTNSDDNKVHNSTVNNNESFL